MSGLGWVGTLAEIMSPKLCMSITLILFTKCAMAWVSGTPVCLARREPSFLNSAVAAGCQPPRDSATMGMKVMFSWRQRWKAPAILASYATAMAWPGVTAALATVAALRGWVTVTSSAAAFPATQRGMRMSAGNPPQFLKFSFFDFCLL